MYGRNLTITLSLISVLVQRKSFPIDSHFENKILFFYNLEYGGLRKTITIILMSTMSFVFEEILILQIIIQ